MSRQRKKGTAFESGVRDGLREHYGVGEDEVYLLRTQGANDQGDVAGLRAHGKKVVVECKNCRTYDLPEWLRQTEAERGNADALAGVCVFHQNRLGFDTPEKVMQQPVVMRLKDLLAIIDGHRDERWD